MTGDRALDHDPFQELDEPGTFRSGAVLPVVSAVDPDHRVHRAVGTVGQLRLVLRVIGRKPGQRGQVSAGRTTRHRNEIAVATEFVDVGPSPRDGGFDIRDVPRPAVLRRDPVVDRQTHPALLGQSGHQRRPLQGVGPENPGTARHKDQHRRGLGGQILAPPHIERLDGVVSVMDATPMEVLVLTQRLPDRRRAFGSGPLEVPAPRPPTPAGPRWSPRGALAIAAPLVVVARANHSLADADIASGAIRASPDAHRGDCPQRLQALADHRQRSPCHA